MEVRWSKVGSHSRRGGATTHEWEHWEHWEAFLVGDVTFGMSEVTKDVLRSGEKTFSLLWSILAFFCEIIRRGHLRNDAHACACAHNSFLLLCFIS